MSTNNPLKVSEKECLTGQCPPTSGTELETSKGVIKLSEGSGGLEMNRLVKEIQQSVVGQSASDWENQSDDGASLNIDDQKLVFTTDSYVVTPIFFKGGNIGTLAFCGTINDLVVMGARPLGISLGLVLEEGFKKSELKKILDTIGKLSKEYKVPVVTGDTKVIEKGKVDKIIINTSGVGMSEQVLNKKVVPGDQIIISGGIGEHAAALLAKRFDMESDLASDSKPLWPEIKSIKEDIKQAKDITRGGLAAILNELADKNNVELIILDEKVPRLEQVHALTEVLGLDIYSLACEGRFVCVAAQDKVDKVVSQLKKYNSQATIIGEVRNGKGVTVQTLFGKKTLNMPSGLIVPRIC